MDRILTSDFGGRRQKVWIGILALDLHRSELGLRLASDSDTLGHARALLPRTAGSVDLVLGFDGRG